MARQDMYPADPDIRAVTSIDPDDLDSELADIAPNLAYWGLLLSAAKSSLRESKRERDVLRGELDEVYRSDLASKKSGRVTDKEVSSYIDRDPEWQESQRTVADADRRVNDLQVVCESIRVKAEALRSLCANIRAEKAALMDAP